VQGRLATSSLRKQPSYIFFSKNSTPPHKLARTEFIIVLKVKLNDKLIAFLFCEALLSCEYYDAKHYYAAVTIVTTTLFTSVLYLLLLFSRINFLPIFAGLNILLPTQRTRSVWLLVIIIIIIIIII
jgi:hypothetical protein